jgi:hypothetical protein
LAEEIDFWLNTAARDLEHARGYAEVAPRIGEPVEAYLDRWLGLASEDTCSRAPATWA